MAGPISSIGQGYDSTSANIPPVTPNPGVENPTDDYGTYVAALKAGVQPGDAGIKDTEGRLSLQQQQQAVLDAKPGPVAGPSRTPMDAGLGMPKSSGATPESDKFAIGGVENPMYYPNQGVPGSKNPAAPLQEAPSKGSGVTAQKLNTDVSQKMGDAWDYLRSNSGPSGKINWADLLIKGLGGIGDAIGASKLAYAGIQSPTRLQQEYKMRLASQQQGNQQQAATTAALKKIDPQTDAAIRQAVATQDNARINEIAAYLGMTPDAIRRIYAGTKAGVLSEQINPRNLGTPEQAADNSVGGAPQGE